MKGVGPNLRAALSLGLGLTLLVAYLAWVWFEPRGPREFAYAPFSLRPLPYASMRGFTYEQLRSHAARAFVLAPSLVLLALGAGQQWLPRLAPDIARYCRTLCWMSLGVTAFVMLAILRGRAISDDELAYSMQASFFRAGRLTGPDLGVTLGDFFNVSTPHGYTVKYLPGEPLLQVLGGALGVPALLHLPLLGLTLWLWYRTLEPSQGPRLAWLATAALACAPMLIFTSATGLSHALCLACAVLMGWGCEQARQGRAVLGSMVAGAAFSAGLLTRPQGIAPVALVLGVALARDLWHHRAFRGVVAFALSSSAGIAALLAYNRLVTGSAFRLPWSKQCDAEHFGFGRVWVTSTYEHSLGRALENLGVVAVRLNGWWLGLPLSLGVLLAFGVLLRRRAPLPPGTHRWFCAGLSVLVFELFYYSPGASDTGAIYHFELLLPGSLVAAFVADALLEHRRGVLALVLGLVLGTGSFVVEQSFRMSRLVETIHADSDAALARITAPALLIHEELADEVVRRGWVFSSFPRRERDLHAPIVTLPRVSTDLRARAERVYPGRACWYFRHLPGAADPQLLSCDAASELLSRPVEASAEALRRVYWERPTAYFESSFDPFRAIFEDRARGPSGEPVVPCCALRERSQGQHEPDSPRAGGAARRCVETGD